MQYGARRRILRIEDGTDECAVYDDHLDNEVPGTKRIVEHAMSDDQKAWDQVYDENKYVILTLIIGSDKKVTLKVKGKVEEDAFFWAAKKGRKYTFDFGLGDEEYEEDDVPRPIRKLIATRGGGPNGNSVKMPDPKFFVKGTQRRPYVEYLMQWQLRGSKPEEYFPQDLHTGYAYIYLQAMGIPAYL